jgi:hypothetical protein
MSNGYQIGRTPHLAVGNHFLNLHNPGYNPIPNLDLLLYRPSRLQEVMGRGDCKFHQSVGLTTSSSRVHQHMYTPLNAAHEFTVEFLVGRKRA